MGCWCLIGTLASSAMKLEGMKSIRLEDLIGLRLGFAKVADENC